MADDDLDLFGAFDDSSATLTVEEQAETSSSTQKRKEAPPTIESDEKSVSPPSKKPHNVKNREKTPQILSSRPASTALKVVEGKRIDATPVEGDKASSGVVSTGTQQKNLISFSVYPPDYEVKPTAGAAAKNPAKNYPFTLDPFQQQAVDYIEAGESVLVSAHTSAGKTAVAEYAIAKSLRDKQRVIYTSPIKALSNQKYRDLEEEFGDVGLMTGDITINPSATCLIMTTEILRSMLYRGSEVMREVAWVIYDEIHYMRDKERGVVWEESIILLPHKVRFVFLSATIPNSKEFAGWICHIHHQPCHVVYTDYRPTPLQHYLFPAGGSGLHLVVDEKGKFREDNFQKAIATLSASADDAASELASYGSNSKRRKAKSNPKKKVGTDVFRIVKLIMERQYDPVIIFSFSKRECESYALLMSKLDFNTEEEKQSVDQLFKNAMDSLSDDDRALPQVDSILPLLRRGIGIHHGGLLPILKEVIEILFGEGLLKCLFATETFSMGLNMPAKTVVFTNCRKYDGKDFRWITAGEYIQMSGRAGRRSLDARGIVIQMLSEQMEPQVAKGILYGQADPLFSTFHLGYNMLLNLMRVEDADPEYMIKQSFHQFQNEQAAPVLEEALERAKEEKDQIVIKNEEEVAQYYYLSRSLVRLKEDFLAIRNKPDYIVRFLNGGRLVKLYCPDSGDGTTKPKWDWGVVVNFTTKNASDSTSATPDTIVHVLLNCVVDNAATAKSNDATNGSTASELPKPAPEGMMGLSSSTSYEMKICPVPLEMLDLLSSLRVYIPKDLRTLESRQAVGKSVKEVTRRFPQGVPLLDPREDMDIQDEQFTRVIEKTVEAEKKLKESPFHEATDKEARFALYNLKMESEAKMRELERKIKESKSLVLRDDLRRRRRVLRRLEFVDKESVIQRKGRTACEVSTTDELLVTEMIFNGQFNDLSVNDTVALLSCLINTEKKKESDKPPQAESLEIPVRQLRETAQRIAKVMHDAKISIDVDEYAGAFNTSLVDVVIAWCQGAKFSQICKMSDAFEGTIIRCLRRLEELLRQLTLAAHSIGDIELEKKFDEGGKKLKRDIVFAASLYLYSFAMKVPMEIPVVVSPGLSSGRHVEALQSAHKHFTEDRLHKAKLSTGINVEYMVESNADAQDPECQHLPVERLVMIIGFVQTKELWGPVIDMLLAKWDARRQGRNLSILTFDNRGVGGSDAPWGRYTTSQMAQDTLSLLNHLGWESAHFVGISMGGMISIELAYSSPERVRSLSLLVSTRGRYIPDLRSLSPLLAAIFSPTQSGVVKNTVSLNYPADFLDRPIGDQDVRSILEQHYTTLPSRHAPPGYRALVCQGMAVQTHYVSDERLNSIAAAGFPVLIVGSMRDILIPPEESVKLLKRLPGDQVRAFFFKNGGHGIDTQFADEVADGLVGTMLRARL
ncbi:hypothetical protein G195_010019 [Phytophthora kernoviae 00238/432]|uniref:Helicase ATP-binding domain-containing protein n=1 Tax=Phytophthora kernoviae 00238/432 TaxID=1284355 RepID=A0A8J4S7E4_9STRA|nr:hypothetical protein G195_010019 [Phytophthora kernoviae 00238/432]